MDKIDILKYVESKTLRDYWEKIDYYPDPMACVYLITYNSNPSISFDTRQKDLMLLSQNCRDMSMKKYQSFVKEKTFGNFIKKLIDTQSDLRAKFISENNPGTYSAEIYKRSCKNPYTIKDCTLFEIYKYAEMKDIDHIDVANFITAGQYIDQDYYIFARLNSDGDVVEILGGSGTAEEDEVLHGFMGIYHNFPHPYKIGDYVRCILPSDEDKKDSEIYKVVELPKEKNVSVKQDDVADNFIDMSMVLLDRKGEKVYIHVHDIEMVSPGIVE